MTTTLLAYLLLAGGAIAASGCVVASQCNAPFGTCHNGVCKCDAGFEPPVCAPFCTNRTQCDNHGDCNAVGKGPQCQCDAGWSGPRCAVSGCSLTCQHGGVPNTPNATCTHCTHCALGWNGKECTVWNPKDLPAIEAKMHQLGAAAEAAQAALRAREHILPGSIGWGANIITGKLTKLPIVKLTYSKDKVYGPNQVPQEATFQPHANPSGIMSPPYYFPTLTQLEGQRMQWTAQSTGRTGYLFGGPTSLDVNNLTQAYERFFRSGLAATVVQDVFTQFSLELPQAAHGGYNVEFDPFVQPMVDLLTNLTTYNTTTKPVFDAFIEYCGTSFTSASTNGGAAEVVYGWKSWLLTQGALGTPVAGDPPIAPFTQADLLQFAQDDFYTDTGLKAPYPFVPGTPNASYTASRPIKVETCFGGTPGLQCGSAAWQASIKQQPDPITWTTTGIDLLIANPEVSAALNAAIAAWIAEENTAWRLKSVCPDCLRSTTCDPQGHVPGESGAVCTCPAPTYPIRYLHDPNKTWPQSMGNACSACVQGWGGATCRHPVCNPACTNQDPSHGGGYCLMPNLCACCPACKACENFSCPYNCKGPSGQPIPWGCFPTKKTASQAHVGCMFPPSTQYPYGPSTCCGACSGKYEPGIGRTCLPN